MKTSLHTTNSRNTFIAIAPDSRAKQGTEPPETANTLSVALRTFRMMSENPYGYTSDDVIFAVYADRQGIPRAKRPAARATFFSKGQACLRASDLTRRYGWGIHHDAQEKVALYGVETDEYAAFESGRDSTGEAIAVKYAMRTKRDDAK